MRAIAANLRLSGWRQMNWASTIGVTILAFWIGCALFGAWLVPFDPMADDILTGLSPPDVVHWFGTDQLGRDVFSRILVGSRDILMVAPVATALGVALGTVVGMLIGYFGGILDMIAGRLLDAFMSLPFVVLVTMAIVALGPANSTVIVVIGLAYTPLVAKTVRAATREQLARDYVQAARLSGQSGFGIVFFEILPNIRDTVLIEFTLRLGFAFFSVATLSFLGLGIQPPSADWGLSIADSYGFLTSGYWWIVAFNSAAIVSLVASVNLISKAFASDV
ncbi:ABC transporter permease [Rhizobium sp. NZLR1]|uniref:ABC transporter permease n=1 Tax=Rhizobium sp. NZLR1 TaxID=2731096 RepID=UPI001A98D807|nr:ABC transporter permease [Rhizobium sp. NZLR1]MBX5204075.1 ABC transporter permease [Rhizobium sp. NZLR1]QSZ25129.1 ABC transporter permease [Rhizobium sp. NZLR1]